MKKIISLTSLLAVGAAALTPVLMTQNMPFKQSQNGTRFSLTSSRFSFTPPFSDPYAVSAAAQYFSPQADQTFAKYQVYLNNAGAKAMWKFTTNGPESGHPANNYLWWLNDYGPGFNTHIEQTGDYLISIANGYQHIHADGAIIEDFEKNIGDSLWNKIETYLKSGSTALLELSFQYNGNYSHRDGFYTNASWPH